MVKKVAIAGVVIVVLLGAVSALPRIAFSSDAVRDDLTRRLSSALGQPVTAASARGSGIGRVTVTLDDVRIGTGPTTIHVDTLQVRTGLSSLVTHRFDGAALVVDHATAQLPLPAMSFASPGPERFTVSKVTFQDLEVTTRGRRLRIDADTEPRTGRALAITRATLEGDDMRISLSGNVTDLATWAGELNAAGDALDGDVLLSLGWDLLDRPAPAGSQDGGAVESGGAARPPASTPPPLVINLDAHRLTLGSLPVTDVKGKASITPGVAAIDPVSFNVLGGRYSGQMTLRYEGGEPSVRWYGDLSNVNLASITTSASGAKPISGLLAGDVDMTGTGIDFTRAMKSARGSARVKLASGSIAKLGLVRSILAATSANPQQAARDTSLGPADTAFTSLSTAMMVSGGSASLLDLNLESDDLSIAGGGGLRLDGSAVTMFGDVQLSEALSRRVAEGRGRQVAPGVRLTVPVTIRGNTDRFQVSVETAEISAGGAPSVGTGAQGGR